MTASDGNESSGELNDIRRGYRINLLDNPPSAQNAFIDKMHIRFDRTRIEYRDNNYIDAMHRMIPLPGTRAEFGIERLHISQTLFARGQADSTKYTFEIREGWLFKGEVIIRKTSPNSSDDLVKTAFVILDLQLNPARFFAYCSKRYDSVDALEQIRNADGSDLFWVGDSETVKRELQADTLDETDNYIDYQSHPVCSSDLSELIDLYIAKVVSFVLSALQQEGQMHVSNEDVLEMSRYGIAIYGNELLFASNRLLSLHHADDEIEFRTNEENITSYDEHINTVSADAILRPNLDDWSIKNLEVFWDAMVTAALSFLHATKPSWKNAMQDAIIREYGLPNINAMPSSLLARESNDINSFSIGSPMTEHISVSVYAKQFDTLRLEVRYQNRSVRDYVNASAERVYRNFSGISPLLGILMENASRRINEIIEAIPLAIREDVATNTLPLVHHFLALLNACRTCSRNQEVFSDLIQGILINGFVMVRSPSVNETDHNKNLRLDLIKLKRRGFVTERAIRRGQRGYFRKFTLNTAYLYSCRAFASAFQDEVQELISE